MSKLGELSGTVEIAIDGIEGVAVSTFAIPIAVLSQDRDGGKLTVAIGTPESTLRAGILAACERAVELVTGNLPTARVEPATGGVLPSAVAPLPVPLPGPHLYPHAASGSERTVASRVHRHRRG